MNQYKKNPDCGVKIDRRLHLRIFGGCQGKNPRICAANRRIFTRKKLLSRSLKTFTTGVSAIFFCLFVSRWTKGLQIRLPRHLGRAYCTQKCIHNQSECVKKIQCGVSEYYHVAAGRINIS